MIDTKKPVKAKQAVRRKFSLKDKQKLYEQWRASGLNKNRFCKQHQLVISAFTKWCELFSTENIDDPKKEWIPVTLSKWPLAEEVPAQISVEIILPNKMMVRLSLALSHLNGLLKELCHATAVIR